MRTSRGEGVMQRGNRSKPKASPWHVQCEGWCFTFHARKPHPCLASRCRLAHCRISMAAMTPTPPAWSRAGTPAVLGPACCLSGIPCSPLASRGYAASAEGLKEDEDLALGDSASQLSSFGDMLIFLRRTVDALELETEGGEDESTVAGEGLRVGLEEIPPSKAS